jgi:hypothetical protein
MPAKKTKKTKRPDEVVAGAAAIVGGLEGVLTAPNLAAATDSVFADGKTMSYWLERYSNCAPEQSQGRAFEFLETLKFNEQAKTVGSDLLANTTQMATPTGPVDIEIARGTAENVVREVQAKSIGDASSSIRSLAHEKYAGQGRLVPADQEAAIRERLERRSAEDLAASQQDDVKKNLMGSLQHDEVTSRGTTRAQADFAARHPSLTVLALEGSAALREVGTAAAEGALVGGVFAGSFAVMRNGVAVARGDKDPREATLDTARAAASAAARSGAVASGARVIAIAGRQHGFTTFASGVAPVAIASTSFEASRCIYRYATGEIETDELWEGVGGAILRGSSAYYCGIAGQMLIPIPFVGALAGALVGYTMSAVLIQSGLLGAGPANEVAQIKERREEIERICAATIETMAECRIEIEELVAEEARVFEGTLLPALDQLEMELVSGTAAGAIESLSQINMAFGSQIPFRNFEDFDEFMLDPDTKLVL